MWLEYLRIQDIFSSLIPLIDEFSHLCTGWRGGGVHLRGQDFAFCLGAITRSQLGIENRVSYGVFLPVYDCLLKKRCMIVSQKVTSAYFGLRSIANHMR